jgi:CheY-like chemotaxis protein/class 3 adenylate cyclase
MPSTPGHILIVDDNVVSRMVLARALAEQGHTTDTAQDGQQALQKLNEHDFDLVLLDVVMPELDGYATLAQIKNNEALRHIPVIMVSAVDEMDSVIRCIAMGATDYLPKPFNASLLQARLNASLASKRLRDLELEYLEQVGYVAEAAAAVESSQFQIESLDPVAARPDALGRLARVFQRMAREVVAREQHLKRQLEQLKLDIEERQRAADEIAAVYVPMDRRQALARGATLPEHMQGAALFADISGFTPLTESLAHELGYQRGAEEITRQLNRVYESLIDQVHNFEGSVISFSGDAITCWFNNDDGLRAAACGLAMQSAMQAFETIQTPAGTAISIRIKIAIVAGAVRRFLVGVSDRQLTEVLAGQLLDDLAELDHEAKRGEVLIADPIPTRFADSLDVSEWGTLPSGKRFARLNRLTRVVAATPWPDLAPDSLPDAVARPWLLPAVYEKVHGGKNEFLSELRPTAALMLNFAGIDYDSDDGAGEKLNAFVTWVQAVMIQFDGSLVQLTMGDKGSYLYLTFGAPIAHPDDPLRALNAAQRLRRLPDQLNFITRIRIGLAYGQMRAGAYGSSAQRVYGVIGDKTNLAARLMAAAEDILCDEVIHQSTQAVWNYETLPPLVVKGKTQPVAVYRPISLKPNSQELIDQLSPALQLTLKVASVIGSTFEVNVLQAIYPVEADKPHLPDQLQLLTDHNFVAPVPASDGLYHFPDPAVQSMAYNLMLFAQRRQLHRAVAEWYERTCAETLADHYATLAHHWKQAEDIATAIAYLEKAGEQARQRGAYDEAQTYFSESLALESQLAGVKK